MVRAFAAASVILTAACAPTPPHDDAATFGITPAMVTAVERQLVMPSGAAPLPDYDRFYMVEAPGRVRGVFVLRDSNVRSAMSGAPIRGFAHSYAMSAESYLAVADGGCLIVSVILDVPTMRLAPVTTGGVLDEQGGSAVAACNTFA